MKVAFFANSAWYLHNYVRHLPEALEKQGHKTVLLSPPDQYSAKLTDSGFRWFGVPLRRQGLNPLAELKLLWRLVGVLRRERPDIIHNFTFKPAFYGSLTGRILGIPGILNALAYPGRPLSGTDLHTIVTRAVVVLFNRFLLGTTNVIFQNSDERNDFVKQGFVKPDNAHLIYGSGVDLETFRPRTSPRDGPSVVLFASRLVWSKGIGEFVEAAQVLRQEFPDVVFRIAGEPDRENPDAVDQDTVTSWCKLPNLDLVGQRDDMPSVYRDSDVAILPTYYREGVPRSLVEAAACGLPIVASDVAGVREIVLHGENGLLVPIKDVAKLVEAIRQLLQDDKARTEMGRRSRRLAQDKFSKERVLQGTLAVYAELVDNAS